MSYPAPDPSGPDSEPPTASEPPPVRDEPPPAADEARRLTASFPAVVEPHEAAAEPTPSEPSEPLAETPVAPPADDRDDATPDVDVHPIADSREVPLADAPDDATPDVDVDPIADSDAVPLADAPDDATPDVDLAAMSAAAEDAEEARGGDTARIDTAASAARPASSRRAPASSRARAAGDGPARMLGPYQVKRRVASGGLSAVFTAIDTRDGSQVAIKVFSAEVSEDKELGWVTEQALALTRGLRHPNLVRVSDGGVKDGRRYTVMESLTGRTLAQELVQGPLSLRDGLSVLRQLIEALAALHAVGMAHRDVTPSNVLLLPDGDGYRVKLLDLDFIGPIGLRRLARTRERLCTPKYTAPEELQRGYPHPRSDLFSAGVVAYELLTGREPFRVEKETDYQDAVRLGTPASLSQLVPELPPELDRFVLGLLARQPSHRYDVASALADARTLEAAINADGPTGRIPLVGPPRAQHWTPGVIGALAAAVVAPLGVLLAAWLASEPTPERLPSAGAAATLPLPAEGPGEAAQRPMPPWPSWTPPGPAAADGGWTQLRLAARAPARPADRRATIDRLRPLAAREGPRQATARRLLSRLLEQEYRALRGHAASRARTVLEEAIETSDDAARRRRLAAELAALSAADPTRAPVATRVAPPPGDDFVAAGTAALARRTVSCLEYQSYLAARPGAARPEDWDARGFPPGHGDRPVELDATAAAGYAGWRGARLPRRSELTRARGLVAGEPEWLLDGDGRVARSRGGGPRAQLRLALTAGARLRGTAPPRTPRHTLRITSRPEGATVLLDGHEVGGTPLTVRLYRSAPLRLTLTLPGHLPCHDYLQPASARQTRAVDLFPRAALPTEQRDYATDRVQALALLAHATRLREQGRTQLARTLTLMVYRAHPGADWAILTRVRQGLSSGPIAAIDAALARLDGRIDALRTVHYRRGDPPAVLWARLETLGYDRSQAMVRVPRGRFASGAETRRAQEKPYATVELPAFWIDRHELSSRAYGRFLRAVGHPGPAHFVDGAPPPPLAEHPVTGITLADARAYARWAGKRLPTEHEWEKAARGPGYRRYPWGQAFWNKAANTSESRRTATVPVGSLALGASFYGCTEMAGNVWEMTATRWAPGSVSQRFTIKGGSYRTDRGDARVAARQPMDPATARADLGVRLAAD